MSTKLTRRSVTAGLALGALASPGLGVRLAWAQTKSVKKEKRPLRASKYVIHASSESLFSTMSMKSSLTSTVCPRAVMSPFMLVAQP